MNTDNLVQKPCTEKFLKNESSNNFKAVLMKNKVWLPKSTGTISISFNENKDEGAWSLIGTDSSLEVPSMNLGYLDPPLESFTYNNITYDIRDFSTATRNYCSSTQTCFPTWKEGATILHEFCHALSFLHEHQSSLFNDNTIKLDIAAVKEHYKDDEAAYINVLNRYACTDKATCDYDGSVFDLKSIMLYYLPDNWIIGGKDNNITYPNFVLSDLDKKWLKLKYPLEEQNPPKLLIKFIGMGIPEWKKAWTAKVVKEVLEPEIGVLFHFEETKFNKLIQKLQPQPIISTTPDEIITSLDSEAIKSTSVNSSDLSDSKDSKDSVKSNNTNNTNILTAKETAFLILVICIGSIFGLFILFLFFKWFFD